MRRGCCMHVHAVDSVTKCDTLTRFGGVFDLNTYSDFSNTGSFQKCSFHAGKLNARERAVSQQRRKRVHKSLVSSPWNYLDFSSFMVTRKFQDFLATSPGVSSIFALPCPFRSLTVSKAMWQDKNVSPTLPYVSSLRGNAPIKIERIFDAPMKPPLYHETAYVRAWI